MFHDLFSWLADKAKPAALKSVNEITHNSFWSVRTIIVVAFLAYLLYLNHLLLTPDNIVLAFKLVVVFLLCNTLTKLGTIAANGWIKATEIREFSRDNHLDESEAGLLSDAPAVVSTPTIPARTP